MSDQLALDFGFDTQTAIERRYMCCGARCADLGDRTGRFPHAGDCPNPNLGVWIDRFGEPLRRLWCDSSETGPKLTGVCPHGGEPRLKPCCLTIVRGARERR